MLCVSGSCLGAGDEANKMEIVLLEKLLLFSAIKQNVVREDRRGLNWMVLKGFDAF